MKTQLLFRDDAYLRETTARVIAVDDAGLQLDQTIFYVQGGGQPGDRGTMTLADGTSLTVLNAVYGADRSVVLHQIGEGARRPEVGERVSLALDWPIRYARMRAHTALHLLSVILPYPVTGGSVGDGEGRLDFDIPEATLDKDRLSEELTAMAAQDAAVSERWITDDELLANPSLVKTMSVKPPMGTGRVRLVEIAGLDLQPCGGTHVRRTGEIGSVAVTGIEKKGKQNRRVRIALA
ncbi:MAG: alanyl-tRNA editing protein [Chelatococcus sp.]|jgi:misacylated tRNA(Ala) deacylase|uniref:alanyl-tRNA editing protein n=1 Tax=Chelatococcus sp. TaxID=1953771 RepID=UPI0025C0EB54|nr:alanyl-tRNA editing protein [Chelatococcus sp.]MBX3536828.1 alanyl-tRNA editing protein [Chelatococcus sp.]